jgi:hypothetical protein
VGGKSGRIGRSDNASTNSSRSLVLDHDLTPEQEAEAQHLYELLQQPFLDEARRFARLLASKPDGRQLGRTEFEVRDQFHRLAAKALQTALSERKKGATRAPA